LEGIGAILASGVIEIWCFLVNDVAVALESMVMWIEVMCRQQVSATSQRGDGRSDIPCQNDVFTYQLDTQRDLEM
jgi:hypothetical protein